MGVVSRRAVLAMSSRNPLTRPERHAPFLAPTVGEGVIVTGLDPSIHDSTHDDHERFERRQLARDRDARRPQTVIVDEPQAADTVRELIDAGVVDVVPDDQVLRHAPSKRSFESNRALVLFHRGWQAREDAD